jgi:hypothetical protein
MDLKGFQVSLWVLLAHEINLLMPVGVKGAVTDAEIAVKPQLQRLQPELRVPEDDVVGIVARHCLLALAEGVVGLPPGGIEEETASGPFDVVLIEGELSECSHSIPVCQLDNHHEIGPSVNVVVEVDLVELIRVKPIEQSRGHPIAHQLLSQMLHHPQSRRLVHYDIRLAQQSRD